MLSMTTVLTNYIQAKYDYCILYIVCLQNVQTTGEISFTGGNICGRLLGIEYQRIILAEHPGPIQINCPNQP